LLDEGNFYVLIISSLFIGVRIASRIRILASALGPTFNRQAGFTAARPAANWIPASVPAGRCQQINLRQAGDFALINELTKGFNQTLIEDLKMGTEALGRTRLGRLAK
jgi:hypothetical protein